MTKPSRKVALAASAVLVAAAAAATAASAQAEAHKPAGTVLASWEGPNKWTDPEP
jgi:ABC-type glycerol-3-phosphate transport system substrate-binding protein